MVNIKFKVVTLERTVFEDLIDWVTIPIKDGQITILPNHLPYIGGIGPGELLIKKGEEKISMAISGGFVEFHNNHLIILANTAEHAEEIDLERAEEARKKAEEVMKQAVSMSELEYAITVAHLEKHLARIKIAKRYLERKGLKTN